MADKSTTTFKLTTLLMLVLFLVYGVLEILQGEVMSFENGFAWDAATYRNVASDFPNQVFNHNLNIYSIQRVLPPALIYFSFKIFNISFTDSSIITAFRILNLASILISIWLFNLIANEFRLKEEIRWLGFFGIFINYAFIKQSFYYPVHTDTAAFALGMALLYFYIKRNYPLMFLITFTGMFTWPSFIYATLPLFVFSYDGKMQMPETGKSKIVTLSLSTIIAGMIIYLYYIDKYYSKIFTGVTPPDHRIIPLSILCLLFYVYFAFRKIINNEELYELKLLLKKIQFRYLIAWILFFICLTVFARTFAGNIAPPETAKSLAGSFLTFAITEPWINLVAHIIYYGPFLLFTILLWNKYCSEIHSHGLGLTLYIIAALLFSIGSESRRFINLMPVIFIFTAIAMNGFEIKQWQLITFGFFSLLFSKIWLGMNTRVFPSDMKAFQDFPWQNYFMNIGPWMSREMYLIQGIAVLVTGIILYFAFVRISKQVKQ